MTEEKPKHFWERFGLHKGQTDPSAESDKTSENEKHQVPIKDDLGLPSEKPGRWGRGQEIAQLRQALEGLSEHLKDQQSLSEQIARVLTPLSGLTEQQTRHLEHIQEQVNRVGEVGERMLSVLQALPKSTREQSEKLATIEDQLQDESQSDRVLRESIETLGQNTGLLVRLAENQQDLLSDIHAKLETQIQQLVNLENEQRRRSRRATVVVTVLTIVYGTAILLLLAAALSNLLQTGQ